MSNILSWMSSRTHGASWQEKLIEMIDIFPINMKQGKGHMGFLKFFVESVQGRQVIFELNWGNFISLN